MNVVKKIIKNNEIIAIFISSKFNEDGINFFTDPEFSQQLAFMKHKKSKIIYPHIHLEVNRNIKNTQEVIILRKGKLQVDLYDKKKSFIESVILNAGDIIMLVSGGHGFKVLDDVEMYEIKQGPYLGLKDKMQF